jgi:peptidoglycan/xylan/chitin deacetylase (PgdA/CDA1 family)
MNIKKLLPLFLVASSVTFCNFYASAFADSSNPKSINYEYPVMKGCLGIGKLKTTRKVVALTFDDGPHQKYTGEILEILRLNNIRATFFVVGKNAQSCKECENAIQIAHRDGNIIGSHTYSHADLRKLTDDETKVELIRTNDIVYRLIRERPALFRSPYGGCYARTAKEVSDLGFTAIAWSDMTNDYDAAHMTPEKIASDIIRYVHPGAIIGLHDGGGNREKTVKALSIIINTLRNDGYEFLTIPELLNIRGYRVN